MGIHIHINGEGAGGTTDYAELKNKPSINGTTLEGNKTATELGLASKALLITYDELVDLRQAGELEPGRYYRITDYQCSTSQDNTQSAGHQFDIIVRADDESHLNENAFAARHDGDTYFSACKLEAWRLKYCLDNDTTRFEWAEPYYGTGVVYEMEDEWGNRCPYDFKNIMFRRFQVETDSLSGRQGLVGKYLYPIPEKEGPALLEPSEKNDIYAYTFSSDANGGIQTDYSLNGMANKVYGNIIEGRDNKKLPDNVFYGSYCYSNKLSNNCFCNSFGSYCSSNSFGSSCYNNSFGSYCSSNSFGSNCNGNSFGSDCHSNSFGSSCYNNSFGSNCNGNSFGSYCSSNSFGSDCYGNSFGSNCFDNSFGSSCYNNSFGSGFQNNSFGSYVRNCTVFDGVKYCSVTGGANNSAYVQNAQILNGTAGDVNNPLSISFAANTAYTQLAAKTTAGDLKVFNPADLV